MGMENNENKKITKLIDANKRNLSTIEALKKEIINEGKILSTIQIPKSSSVNNDTNTENLEKEMKELIENYETIYDKYTDLKEDFDRLSKYTDSLEKENQTLSDELKNLKDGNS